MKKLSSRAWCLSRRLCGFGLWVSGSLFMLNKMRLNLWMKVLPQIYLGCKTWATEWERFGSGGQDVVWQSSGGVYGWVVDALWHSWWSLTPFSAWSSLLVILRTDGLQCHKSPRTSWKDSQHGGNTDSERQVDRETELDPFTQNKLNLSVKIDRISRTHFMLAECHLVIWAHLPSHFM